MIDTERDHLQREMVSKALINTDTSLYNQRQIAKQRDLRLKKLETDYERLKQEVQELRELVKSLST